MNEGQEKQKDLIETTDTLEAIGVFRGWMGFFFVILVICLIVLQGVFWLVDTGIIKGKPAKLNPLAKAMLAEAAETASDANQPAAAPAGDKGSGLDFISNISREQVGVVVQIANWVTIMTGILYCLTMIFALKISLVGRLGGINHISRAFFFSLVALAVMLPWQKIFGGIFFGALYVPSELWNSLESARDATAFHKVIFCLRFAGLWLLVLILEICAQWRSSKWSKATLRRLEVI